MADNRSLTKLSLCENENISRDGLTYLMKGLVEADESKLVELDLAKCNLNSQKIEPLTKLIGINHKIRSINLKGNSITDEGGIELLGSVNANEFITKINLDLNPFRHGIIKDIEA